jgi:hypothetical protein
MRAGCAGRAAASAYYRRKRVMTRDNALFLVSFHRSLVVSLLAIPANAGIQRLCFFCSSFQRKLE